MKTLILLGGVSGSGKTWARLHDPALKDLPYMDVADMYAQFTTPGEFGTWKVAWSKLVEHVRYEFEEGHDTVVVEGALLPHSSSLGMVMDAFKDCRIEWMFFHAPFEVCEQRLRDDGAWDGPRGEVLRNCWHRAQRYWEKHSDTERNSEYIHKVKSPARGRNEV